MLLRVMQRHRVPDASSKILAVAQQEEQQIQHDKEADDQADRVLPDCQRLSRDELPGLVQHGGEPLLNRGKIGQVEVIQQAHCPSRQHLRNLAEELADIEFADFDALVGGDGLPEQRRGDPDDRQDDNKHDNRERQQSRQILSLPRSPAKFAGTAAGRRSRERSPTGSPR